MDDLISRQAEIAKFEPWLKVEGYSEGELNMLKAVLYEITVMPSTQPEQRWIPVTERLPEPSINPNTLDFKKVLCSTAFGDVRAYGYGKPHGHDVAHFWHGCGIMDVYVKAWMPLPEPYKEDPCNGCDYLGESCVGEGCGKLEGR